MAVLQKMREKFGVVISVIIALSLLYFIAPMDDLMTLFGKPQNVGEIAGTGISYEDFQNELNTFTTINEITTGSSAQNEQTQKQIQNAAWQSLLDRYMFFKNCNAAGIHVSDAEVADLLAGEHVSPVIAQNPLFFDENGVFSADRVREINRMAEDDATLKTYWNYLKNTIRTQQYYSKYAALFTLTALENPVTLADAVAVGNTTADIELVTVPYGYTRDTTITVSSSEIKSYYKAHEKDYKQTASRDIEYVVFEVKPSQKDIAQTEKSINDVLDEFAQTDNMKSFLLKNSDRNYSEYWYRKGELKTVCPEVDDFAFSSAKGVSPVYKNGDSFFAARVMKSANVPDSVYVKHILFQGADAKKEAEEVLAQVIKKPSQFSTLAAEHSADKNSAADGELGNIGWMTQTYMIPGLESVITAKPGVPYIVKSQYGTHIVLVTKTTKPVAKKQVAVLEKTVLASKETFNTFYAQANKFSTIANGTYEGYLRAVDSLGVYSHKQNKVLESTSTYGSIDQARELTRWVFDAKKNKASNVITVNNNYFFVAAVKNIHKDGIAPLEDVAAMIQNKLYIDKRNEKKTAELAAQTAGLSLEQIAENHNVTVSNRADISFSPTSAAAVEPALLGAIYNAPVGEVCGPVKGNQGVYMFKVTRRDQGAFFTESDAKNFTAQKAQYSTQMLMPVMEEAAGVVDNRARYF
ncbi:MAG: SurA N-terminal domain-containing protein [Candidatus Cryptobacteroides sp.]